MSDVPELETTEDSGGPRQSFWSHLEELRKAIIRSCIAIGLALVLCMAFTHKLVAILEYPLRNIDIFEKPKPTVTFRIGTAELGPYVVTRDQFPNLPPGDAPNVVFEIGATTVADQQVPTLKMLPPAPEDNEGPLQVRLHNFGPAEGFFLAFRVAIYGALMISAPFWIYFLAGFIMPALHRHERKALFPWVICSFLLFAVGVLSTYFLLLPIALRASILYSQLLGFEGLDWRADEYIGFVTHFIFGMGLGFQFPVIVLFLVKLGLLTHQQLAKYRRHVCILVFILGALLTTPEVITQVAMAVPLYILYECCIWIAWYWERKKRKAELANAVE